MMVELIAIDLLLAWRICWCVVPVHPPLVVAQLFINIVTGLLQSHSKFSAAKLAL